MLPGEGRALVFWGSTVLACMLELCLRFFYLWSGFRVFLTASSLPRRGSWKPIRRVWGSRRESETVAAKRVVAINPPIDDTDPIRKFSIDPGIHTNLGRTSQLSGLGWIFLVTVTDFAMNFSAKKADFFSCVSLKERRILGRILGRILSLAKDGKMAKIIWGWKSTRKSTIKIHAELQVKHAV